MRPRGVAINFTGFRLGIIVVAAAYALRVASGGAEPTPKPETPPPVIPRNNADTPGAQPEPLPADGAPAAPGVQPLPDNLPILVDPARPGIPPRSRPARAVAQPLLPEEEGSPDETIPLEQVVIDQPVVEQEQDLATYLVENPLARTALSNAFNLADSFYDGFGGIPDPRSVALLPRAGAGETPGFRLGPLSLRPALASAFISYYDRGGGKTRRNEELVAATVSGILGSPETGRYVTLDYGASRLFGSDLDDQNKIDQSLFLAGHLLLGKLKLGIGIDFATLSGYNRDIGDQAQRDFLTIALTATYQLTPRVSLDWDLAMPDGRYPGAGSAAAGVIGDSSGFSSTNYINYEYSPKTQIGLGFSTGYVEVEDADQQTFQQVLGRISAVPTAFINYSASVGLEFRDTGHRTTTNPIFILGASWIPRERTAISLVAQQRVQNSATSTEENFLTSSVILTLSQQLGNRFSLAVSAGFENAKYESIGAGVSSDREDRTYLGQLSLSARLTERLNLAATLSYTKTDSNVAPAEIAQFALHASFTF